MGGSPNGCLCDLCPLSIDRDGGPVPGDIPANASLAIVGEAPGQRECAVGRPFVGPSGRTLDDMLRQHGLHRDRVVITNALLCRPPGNALGDYRAEIVRKNAASKRSAKATGLTFIPLGDPFMCCRQRLLRDIAGTRAVVAMGSSALWSMIGERAMAHWAGSPALTVVPGVPSGITEWADVPSPGSVVAPGADGIQRRVSGQTWVLPVFHPAFVMREEGRAFQPILRRHFAKAARIYRDDITEWDEPNLTVCASFSETLSALRNLHGAGSTLAVDIETTDADVMGCTLTAVGISGGDIGSVCVIYWRVDGSPAWSPTEMRALDGEIRAILINDRVPKVFHNMAFDVFVLERLGYDIRGDLHDTMLMHHSCWSDLPHDLNFLGSQYTDVRYYKSDVREKGKFRPTDDLVFARYNARDALLTHRLLKPLAADCKHQRQVYNQERQLIRQGMDMTRIGMRVDLARATEIQVEMAAQTSVCLERMKDILSCTNYESAMLAVATVAQQKAGNWQLLEEHAHNFKPASPYCLQVAVQSLGIPISDATVGAKRARTATNLIATGKDVLNTVAPYCDEAGVDFIQALIGQVDIKNIERYDQLGWRQATKLSSTYLIPMQDYLGSDGRLHPSWKVHGTVSGRYATASPNVQNWPKLMKPLIIPADGHVFVEIDYAQLEWRISAVLSGDTNLLKAFATTDPHRAAASELFSVAYDDVTGAMRRFWKTFLYAFSYGATLEKIHEQMILADRTTTKQAVTEMMQSLKTRYPTWMAYRETLAKIARQQGFLESPLLGRRRMFFGGVDPTKALNFPAQSGAADIINDACLRLIPILRQSFPRARMINQCHDAVTIECPEGDAPGVVALLEQIMPGPYKLTGAPPMLFPIDVFVSNRWGEDSKKKKVAAPTPAVQTPTVAPEDTNEPL